MRILNNDSDKKLDNITLCLTKAEAEELKDTLEGILAKPKSNHGHIPDYEASKELTVCVYDTSDLDSSFHDRIKKLIKEDC